MWSFGLGTHVINSSDKWHIWLDFCDHNYCNPSLGFATKARACEGAG
jgi:hypothetical protein